jgi:hypothetical protein
MPKICSTPLRISASTMAWPDVMVVVLTRCP